MNLQTQGYAVHAIGQGFKPYKFERRPIGQNDIHIEVLYCGICHSDLKMVKSQWEVKTKYPIVPGHEIVGVARIIGECVTKFKIGDYVAVGCYVNTCKCCKSCEIGWDSYCRALTLTYNSDTKDIEQYTKGGFSHDLVVDERYAFIIPKELHQSLAEIAPLMCAGITVYSPMLYYNMLKPGKKIGIIGLGGLGHMAVKFAVAIGAHVTVISTSISKKEDALVCLKANDFLCSKNPSEMVAAHGSLDFVIDTSPTIANVNLYVPLLTIGGKYVLVGIPTGQNILQINGDALLFDRKSVAGSLLGSLEEHQLMLEFCAKHNITSSIKLICSNELDAAFLSLAQNTKTAHRYVLDLRKSKEAEQLNSFP